MNGLCHQTAIGCQHKPPQFRINSYIIHTFRHKYLLISPAHTFADDHNIIRFFIRPVRNAHPAGEIDKRYMNIQFPPELHRQRKQNFRQRGIIRLRSGIACQKGVNSEMFYSFLFHIAKGFLHLLSGHAIFRIPRLVHNIVLNGKIPARIKTAAHGFPERRDLFIKFQMGNIVEIYDCPQIICQFKILSGCHIGRKHNLVSRKSHFLWQIQLRIGGTVHTNPLLPQNLHQKRIRRSFHRKIFLKSPVPRKSRFQLPCIFPDSFLIIDMKRRRIFLDNLLYLGKCNKRLLFHLIITSFLPVFVSLSFYSNPPVPAGRSPAIRYTRLLW